MPGGWRGPTKKEATLQILHSCQSQMQKSSGILKINAFSYGLNDPYLKTVKKIMTLMEKNTSIHTLDFTRSSITDSGAIYIINALKDTAVRTLILSDNLISDAGIKKFLAGLKKTTVDTLDFSSNKKLSKAGIKKLVDGLKDTKVVELNIANSKLCPDGTADLIDGLKGTKIISLNIANNELGNFGAKCLAEGLKYLAVHTLNISYNYIGDEGFTALFNGLNYRSLQNELNISNNRSIGIVAIKALTDGLKKTNADEREIPTLTLNLSGICIGNDDVIVLVDELKQIKNIHTLNISRTDFSLVGAVALAEGINKLSIRNLDISYNRYFDDDCLNALSQGLKRSSVRTLQLSDVGLTKAGITLFADSLQETGIQNLTIHQREREINCFGVEVVVVSRYRSIPNADYLYLIKKLKNSNVHTFRLDGWLDGYDRYDSFENARPHIENTLVTSWIPYSRPGFIPSTLSKVFTDNFTRKMQNTLLLCYMLHASKSSWRGCELVFCQIISYLPDMLRAINDNNRLIFKLFQNTGAVFAKRAEAGTRTQLTFFQTDTTLPAEEKVPQQIAKIRSSCCSLM